MSDKGQKHALPVGELLLRTLAMPADTNPNGDIFGGWIMSQMDIAGGIFAKDLARSRVVTVAADSITFFRPVHVGDVVCCYGKVLRTGTTSVTINLEVWVKRPLEVISNRKVISRLQRLPSPMWPLMTRERNVL